MNQAHRRNEVSRLKTTIVLKQVEYSIASRTGEWDRPTMFYETMNLQACLDSLTKLAKESHAQR